MIALLALLGCPKAPPAAAIEATVGPPPFAALGDRAWESPAGREHPLVGVVWSVEEGAAKPWDDLLASARGARWLFLGEKHDNADHHRLQAEVIAAVAPGAVVFEHLDHQDPVAETRTPDALAAAVGWDESGWPPFAIYRPVFAAAFDSGARIVAGHPTRAEVKLAMSEGFGALTPEAVAGLPLEPGLPAPLREDLAREVVDSHCGMANEAMVEKMVRGQLLKDTWMARAMREAQAATRAPTVLVAGNGHTRGDRGVPLWLDAPDGGERVTVAFVEVGTARDPAAVDPEGADWLVFTPRHDDDDPCAAFRK